MQREIDALKAENAEQKRKLLFIERHSDRLQELLRFEEDHQNATKALENAQLHGYGTLTAAVMGLISRVKHAEADNTTARHALRSADILLLESEPTAEGVQSLVEKLEAQTRKANQLEDLEKISATILGNYGFHVAPGISIRHAIQRMGAANNESFRRAAELESSRPELTRRMQEADKKAGTLETAFNVAREAMEEIRAALIAAGWKLEPCESTVGAVKALIEGGLSNVYYIQWLHGESQEMRGELAKAGFELDPEQSTTHGLRLLINTYATVQASAEKSRMELVQANSDAAEIRQLLELEGIKLDRCQPVRVGVEILINLANKLAREKDKMAGHLNSIREMLFKAGVELQPSRTCVSGVETLALAYKEMCGHYDRLLKEKATTPTRDLQECGNQASAALHINGLAPLEAVKMLAEYYVALVAYSETLKAAYNQAKQDLQPASPAKMHAIQSVRAWFQRL